MKRICIAAVVASSIALSGCIGSFTLTNKVYSWNEKATDNKYVNSAILWVLLIVPVYDVTLFVDFVGLNTIEFWTGKNPVAFTGPDKLEKVVVSHGKTYRVTMGNNAITVDRLDGSSAGREFALQYDPAKKSFFMNDCNGLSSKVASIDQSLLTLYSPDGRVTTRSLDGNPMPIAFAR
ncbi:MAG: DUF3332 domain-containing protein [Chitinispirillaceae bacterium]|jgi:hypothetical protein